MRKFVSLLFLLAIIGSTRAQEVTSQETQAKEDSIFNVKISEEAHYAEVTIDYITKDDKDVSATEMESMRLLQTHIIEIFSKRFKMNNKDVQEIWDIIDDKCQNVEIKRGDLWSVFSYITKDAFSGLFHKKKIKPLTPQDSLILFGPQKTENIISSTNPTEKTKVEVKEEVVKTETEQVAITENKTGTKQVAITEDKKETEQTVAAEEKKEPEIKDVVIPELCQKIIAKETFHPLTQFLNQEKNYGNLVFGSSRDMQRIEKCYIVILSKTTQKIVAVLDKGESGRINFITKKHDDHRLYDKKQYVVIFIQEYNK